MGAAPLLVKVCGGGNKNKVLCHGMIRGDWWNTLYRHRKTMGKRSKLFNTFKNNN